MEKILITGVNGMLGHELVKQLLQKNFYVIGTSKGQCRIECNDSRFKYYSVDINAELALHDVMETERADVIIHTAAMTQVDECELNQDDCFKTNVNGTIAALVAAEMFHSFFIYISTDFVFDGEKEMYKEEDELSPLNWYGKCKEQAETIVSSGGASYAIVRTCLVYSKKTAGGRDNIITWVNNKLSAGEKIKVVDDQLRTPTYVGDLAKGIIHIVERKAEGIYHLSGEDVLTPYEMAIVVAQYKNLDTSLIERVTADTFTQPAKRPAKTGFVIDKARKELNYEPLSFMEGLKKALG